MIYHEVIEKAKGVLGKMYLKIEEEARRGQSRCTPNINDEGPLTGLWGTCFGVSAFLGSLCAGQKQTQTLKGGTLRA